MPAPKLFLHFLTLSLVIPMATLTSRADEPIDFNRDIRPILSNNCLKCHGIDDKARKGNLRLDVRESALAPTKSEKPAIVPGHPEKSELVKRLFTEDEDDVMPPISTKKTLTDAQKKLLKTWIAQGAPYAPHWAFVPPQMPALPTVNQKDWPRNPIDYFILAKLESQNLKPSAPADKYTLVRRAYLDLIGLPPTPEEADAFANDPSPQAYENLVDRLLASPHYGERWARRWLDLARYADTNGYEKDRPRQIWPYRDWVINALNADKPFDQFTVEQLAGDLLPNSTVDQKIATGFHRNTMINEEGGIDPLEYRFHAMVDRIGTTGTTWLGLTVACAQCHTHKYDPITHTEYYSLMAFLNNANEPLLPINQAEIAPKKSEILAKIAQLEDQLPEKFPVTDITWETPPAKVTLASKATPQPASDNSWRITGESPDKDTYTFVIQSDLEIVDRIRVQVLMDDKKGPGRTPHGNFVLTEISANVARTPEQVTPVKFTRAEADFSQNQFNVADAIDGQPQTGWGIAGQPPTDRTATFFLDKPLTLKKGSLWTIKLDQQYGGQHTIARLRVSLGGPSNVQGDPASRRNEIVNREFNSWLDRESKNAVKWTVLRPIEIKSSTPILTLLPDDSVLGSGDITKSDTYDLTYNTDSKQIVAVRLEALPDESLPANGPGMIYYEGPMGDFCLSEINLAADGKELPFTRAAHSFAAGNFEAAKAIDGNPQTGWMINGGQGKPHTAVFALAAPASISGQLKLHMLFERHFAPALGRFRVSITADPRAGQGAIHPPQVEQALATPQADRTEAQNKILLREWALTAPQLASARAEIEKLRSTIPKPQTTLVMSERPEGFKRVTHLHNRGEFTQPKEVVEPNVPAFLPPLPAGATHNRLAFARWLVSPENPLTARVTVNRNWAALFGRGIVRTTEDFGFQGELPSNQPLLDFLAVQFVKDNWSMKKLHRLIVTSAAYQQSSRETPDLLAKDPQNILISRGPRFRMEAELVRDSALRASGLLSEKLGGPSVFPPQPASVTTEGAYGPLTWTASTGEDRYRRSLYTFAKRTAPFAMYNCFDAPSGEACVARREMSNTPLQALTLMNDTVFLEAAQAFGKSIAAKKDLDDSAKATLIFRHCLTRPPEPAEVEMIVQFAAAQRQRFTAKELDASKIAGPGQGDAIDRAVWTTVARAIMNLDEMVTKN